MKTSTNIMVVLPFILCFALTSCLKEDRLNLPLSTIEPVELGDGLLIASPRSQNVDPQLLNEAYEYALHAEEFWPLRSLLVFRNGYLISEHYYKSTSDITTNRLIWSCTKQVTAMAAGICIDQGLLTLSDPISTIMGNALDEHPEKANITIRDLLTMQSGIKFSNDGVGGETDQLLRQQPKNSLAFILNLDQREPPGTSFHYNDGDPHLVSIGLQNVVGMSTGDWAKEVLFDKIGISGLDWVKYKDGTTFGGFGIETTARQLSKLGLLVANKGVYEGEQIISQEWIEEMTSKQVETPYNNEMGYYWWINESRNIHFMNGHGGQYTFICPDSDVVITMTAFPNTQEDYQITEDEAFLLVDKILTACN